VFLKGIFKLICLKILEMKIIVNTVAFLCCFIMYSRDIYVSKSGNDSNSGNFDTPYLTLSKASAVAVAGDVVFIREGVYEEVLKPSNSGTASSPIIFQGYQNEKVVISAMQAISNWTSEGNGIYKTTLNWDLGQRNFVMNDTDALDLARWPNNTDGDRFTLNSLRNDGGSQDEVSTDAFLTDSDIPNWNWENGGSLVFYGDRAGSGWTTWRSWIKSSSAGRINFDAIKSQSWIITAHPPGDFGDYYLEGIKEALDYKNEWFFDSTTRELFVKLPNDVKPTDGKVKMSRREKAIDLSNKNYIHIKNLAVFGGTVEIEGKGTLLYEVSSFYGSMTRGINPNFNSGVNAIDIGWNAVDTTIEKCEIGFGDGTGIWDSATGTTIKNNYIHDFDFLGSYDAPLMVRGRANAKILNNVVTRGGRDALQIISKGSEVAWNDFSHSNLIADDCALLYTISPDLNMEIHHNWFHDAEGRGKLKKAAGIYLDNSAGDVRVYRNVVWNVEWTAIQINWDGKDIDIFNNTLVKAKSGTMGAWHKSGTQFTNVKVWNNITDKVAVDDEGNQETEATWEPQSDKQNNLISDAVFSDYENNDFSLKANSEAVDFGRVIEGYTNDFTGTKPDVGAYEFGQAIWKPGVDWNTRLGPSNKCYGLPGEGCLDNKIGQDNFKLVVTSESCSKSNDGSISISAAKNFSYKVTLSGESNALKNFEETTSFENLKAGVYDVCITIASIPEFEQCYSVAVTEPEDLQMKVDVEDSKRQVNLELIGGSSFEIELNGVVILTNNKNITLQLKSGSNNLKVKTDKECQGVLNKNIVLDAKDFDLYPNPVESILTINSYVNDKNIEVLVRSSLGKIVYRNNFNGEEKSKFLIDTSNLSRGIYIVTIINDGENEILRFIKK
jgi:hypothetical protein